MKITKKFNYKKGLQVLAYIVLFSLGVLSFAYIFKTSPEIKLYPYRIFLALGILLVTASAISSYYLKRFEKVNNWKNSFISIFLTSALSAVLLSGIFALVKLLRLSFYGDLEPVFLKTIFLVFSIVWSSLVCLFAAFVETHLKKNWMEIITKLLTNLLAAFIFLLLPAFMPKMGLWVILLVVSLVLSVLSFIITQKVLKYAK